MCKIFRFKLFPIFVQTDDLTMKKITLLLLILGSAVYLSAQAPTSNLYLFNLAKTGDTTFQFSVPKFLSAFNLKGYNNHPYFFNDNELYIASQAPKESQPELYSLNILIGTRTRVTDTYDGEYSPRPVGDGQNFSAVRMEFPVGDTIQRLWQFPLSRSGKG